MTDTVESILRNLHALDDKIRSGELEAPSMFDVHPESALARFARVECAADYMALVRKTHPSGSVLWSRELLREAIEVARYRYVTPGPRDRAPLPLP